MSAKIKKIDLQNFQCYERISFNIDNFNILVGSSSSGKTSILRALRFMFYGDWDSTFAREAEKPTGVAITLDNGIKIIRLREGNNNKAAIIRGDDITKYKSFGNIIPDLHNILNLKPIDISGKSINLNFSLQDDAPFMISESKATKAQWLGRLYGAHIINEMLRVMSKDKNQVDSEYKKLKKSIGEHELELKLYDNIEEHKKVLKECQSLISKLKTLKDVKVKSDILRMEEKSINSNLWVKDIDTKDIKNKNLKLIRLKMIKKEYDELQKEKEYLKKHKKIDIAGFKKSFELLVKLIKIKELLANNKEKAIADIAKYRDNKANLIRLRENTVKFLLDNKVCPICEQSINQELANQIIKNLINRR